MKRARAKELVPREALRRRLPDDLRAEFDGHCHEADARGGPLDYDKFSLPLTIYVGVVLLDVAGAEPLWEAEELEGGFSQRGCLPLEMPLSASGKPAGEVSGDSASEVAKRDCGPL
jgi:hypothetical protein